MCGTVTPPLADCESSIFLGVLVRGRLLAPHLADCNIVGHTPGVELMILVVMPCITNDSHHKNLIII
jgi:hypothetical protein